VRVAFWSYDLYPFVLGGEGEFTADGNFRAFSYGRTFKRESIIAVFPLDEGKLVKAKLDRLNEEYRQRRDALLHEMVGKAHSALPGLKEHRKKRGYTP
jgi:hypothetical protein